MAAIGGTQTQSLMLPKRKMFKHVRLAMFGATPLIHHIQSIFLENSDPENLLITLKMRKCPILLENQILEVLALASFVAQKVMLHQQLVALQKGNTHLPWLFHGHKRYLSLTLSLTCWIILCGCSVPQYCDMVLVSFL
jgi:hypothetical protein